MRGKKSYPGLFLVSLLLIAQVWVAGAQDTTPRIWPSAELDQAVAGQEFTVEVHVGDASQVYGGSFQLLYDPQAFEVVLNQNNAVTPGAFFGSAPSFPLKNSADPAAGTVDYALTLTQPAEPVSGEGNLGTVTFRALKDAPVNMTVVKATLVSPEFTQVDGRLVAQKINQVEALISPITLSVGTQTASQVVPEVQAQPEAIVVAAPSTDTATASVSVSASGQALNEQSAAPLIMERQPNNRVLIVAGLFFFAGLVLLIISVGMYSKMRVRFSFAGDNLPEHSL